LREGNVRQVLDSTIKVKLFTAKGTIEKNFPLTGTLRVKNNYGQEHILTPEMFRNK
jgi:hypothetical protein